MNPPRVRISVGNRDLSFPSAIQQLMTFEGRIVVLLSPKGLSHNTQPHVNGNILCFGENGELLWEVERRDVTPEEAQAVIAERKRLRIYGGSVPDGRLCSFLEFQKSSGYDNAIRAWNGEGWAEISLESGKILNYEFTK